MPEDHPAGAALVLGLSSMSSYSDMLIFCGYGPPPNVYLPGRFVHSPLWLECTNDVCAAIYRAWSQFSFLTTVTRWQ